MKNRLFAGVLLLVLAFGSKFAGEAGTAAQKSKSSSDTSADNYDWPVYGGTPDNDHYSPLTNINQSNVKKLAVAWSFDTKEEGGLQTSPIVVRGVLYGISPTQKVFALDGATGKLLWKFDSGIVGTQPDRGLCYWTDGKSGRILVGVMNFLYGLDAATGKPIATFGDAGRIDLRKNLGREPAEAQSIYLTSPGVVYKDLIIVGGRQPETLPAPPATSALSTCAVASCDGRFIPFRTQASLAQIPGRKMHGKAAARPTIGPACRWIPNVALFTFPPVPRHSISTAVIVSATISSRIA